jgi:hypothetical protein
MKRLELEAELCVWGMVTMATPLSCSQSTMDGWNCIVSSIFRTTKSHSRYVLVQLANNVYHTPQFISLVDLGVQT